MNPHVMAIRSGIPANNVKEFIAYGKDNPGKLNFGAGNTGGLANAWLFMSTGGFTPPRFPTSRRRRRWSTCSGGRIDFMSVDYFIVNDHFSAARCGPSASRRRPG